MAEIYNITCIPTGYCYVGHTSRTTVTRFQQHRAAARRGDHRSRFFQRAWDKYGEDAFTFTVVEVCSEEEKLLREQYWIDVIKPQLNWAPVAGSSLGIKRSDEFREKLAGNRRGVGNRGAPPEKSRTKLAAQKKDPAFLDACRNARAERIALSNAIDAILHPPTAQPETLRRLNSIERQYWMMFGDGAVLPARRWRSGGHRVKARARGLYKPRAEQVVSLAAD